MLWQYVSILTGFSMSQSEEQLRAEIRSMIGFKGTERVTSKSLAKEWGVSESYLSDVINGHKGVGDKLAEAMGYTRYVVFYKNHEPRKQVQK